MASNAAAVVGHAVSMHVLPSAVHFVLQLSPELSPTYHIRTGEGGGGCGGCGGGGGGGHSYPENPMFVMHEQVPQGTSPSAVAEY